MAEAINPDWLNQTISLLDMALSLIKNSANNASTALDAASDAFSAITKEVNALGQSFNKAATPHEKINALMNSSIGQYALLAFRLNNINTSVYGATEAFTSINSTIDATKNAFEKMLRFGQSFVGLIPVVGKLINTKLLDKFALVLNFATETIKFQIDAAQKVTNAFLDISKTGATFGGSMNEFAALSARIGVPMQLLAKVTKENVENLSKFGARIEIGAGLIFNSAKKIFNGNSNLNDQVLAMYGSFEDLSEGVANYYSLLTQTGVRITRNLMEEKEKSGEVQNYLIAQKQLTALTGKSAKALKEAEEKRRNELDYSMKANRLANKDAQNNLQTGMELITKIFGQEAGDVAKEFFATGGNLYTKTAIEFAGVNVDAFKSIQKVIGTIDTDRTTFEKGVGEFFKANAPAFIANAKLGEELFSLNRAANNSLLTTLGNVNVSIVANANFLQNAAALFENLRIEREKVQEGKPQIDAATQAFLNSTRMTLERQLEIDKAIFKNIAGLDKLTEKFFDLQSEMIRFQSEMFRTVKDIIPTITDITSDLGKVIVNFGAGLLNITDKIQENIIRSSAPTTPAAPAAPTTPTPTPAASTTPTPAASTPPAASTAAPRATGGIAAGPTLVGEDGTEAVIPLEKGPIPLNIDWRPLVSIMNQQVSNLEDIKGLLENTQSIQKNILEATY